LELLKNSSLGSQEDINHLLINQVIHKFKLRRKVSQQFLLSLPLNIIHLLLVNIPNFTLKHYKLLPNPSMDSY